MLVNNRVLLKNNSGSTSSRKLRLRNPNLTSSLYPNVIAAIGHTPLVELQHMSPKPNVRIFAKLEGLNPSGSVKDRVAKFIVEQAEADGSLNKSQTILEATSGNTGISISMVGKYMGYKITVVMPSPLSEEKRRLFEIFGTEVILSENRFGMKGSIQMTAEMSKNEKKYFNANQYGNPMNPLAHYETTGPEILDALPQIDVFVAGMGTGGTLMGVGRRLKERNRAVKIIGVEPKANQYIQGLISHADGYRPPILDVSLLDRIIPVDMNLAVMLTRQLAEQESIFAGISSGAVLASAMIVAKNMTAGNIVCLLADGGWKYLSTDLWTQKQPFASFDADQTWCQSP